VPLEEDFAAWIEPRSNQSPPLVIVGAGLSYGLTPTARALASEVSKRQAAIEADLSIRAWPQGSIGTDENRLYEWADHCVQAINHGDAKARLARAMGLTTDQSFLANAGVTARGTTPRHRVLARLAREGRIRAFWSFNWDCWLEACLNAVGMRRHNHERRTRWALEGWKTHYDVWFSDKAPESATDCQPLFKGHGCVEALNTGVGDFIIQKSEMDMPWAQQHPVLRDTLCRQVQREGGAIAIGWSASEKYVVEFFRSHSADGVTRLPDGLTVVDLNPNQTGHCDAATGYARQPHAVVQVNPTSPGTTDDLMLWIQTQRGLRTMSSLLTNAQGSAMSGAAASLPAFDAPLLRSAWIVSFFDDWLPVWLRNCCLCGAQSFDIQEGKTFQVLPSDRRDAHIPWCNPLQGRRDLQAAASLLLRLLDVDTSVLTWDLDTFPGALWDVGRRHLVLPIPVWVDADSARSALKPLIESIHWQSKARIKSATLLPLRDAGSANTPEGDGDDTRLVGWREAFSACFQHPTLSQPELVTTCNLDALAQLLQEP
jgi:hypothetical protein